MSIKRLTYLEFYAILILVNYNFKRFRIVNRGERKMNKTATLITPEIVKALLNEVKYHYNKPKVIWGCPEKGELYGFWFEGIQLSDQDSYTEDPYEKILTPWIKENFSLMPDGLYFNEEFIIKDNLLTQRFLEITDPKWISDAQNYLQYFTVPKTVAASYTEDGYRGDLSVASVEGVTNEEGLNQDFPCKGLVFVEHAPVGTYTTWWGNHGESGKLAARDFSAFKNVTVDWADD